MLNASRRRTLRQIAHHLDPVVSVGNNGVSPAVLTELERALKDHELIKVKIHQNARDERQAVINALSVASPCELVQTIGKIVVLYRANPDADPALSNVLRSGLKLS